MSYTFKKLSDIASTEMVSDSATVLVEENGEIVRVPKGKVGGVQVASTASVGQTIIVKSVNNKGVPVEWEVINFPTDDHIKAMIIGQYTFTAESSILNSGGVYTPIVDEYDSITDLIIPEDVTFIGADALDCFNSVKKLYFNAANYELETISTETPDSKSGYFVTFTDSPFYKMDSLKTVILGENVSNIAKHMFREKTNLAKVIITGNNLKSIDMYAFYRCTNLSSINIPEGVESIGAQAFYYCSNLQTITIPRSVTSIGENAFYTYPASTTRIFNVYENSYAHTWAIDNGFNYNLIVEE